MIFDRYKENAVFIILNDVVVNRNTVWEFQNDRS